MINAIVVEDERKAAENLRELLGQYCPSVRFLGHASDAEEAREQIQRLQPDLIFLDVEMPRQNGFDLLESLGNINFSVVFTTAYDHYALRAIKFSALDYLLKPIDGKELAAVIDKYERLADRQFLRESFRNLAENLRHKELQNLAVPDQSGISFISLDEVIYLQADRNYSTIHLKGGERMVSTRTLKEYDLLLQDNGFFRAHHSFLVHLKHVKRFEKSGYLLMEDGLHAEVAQRRKAELLEVLKNR